MDWIDALESQSIADCKPDLTLLFDLPVEVGLARIDQDRDRDRFESEALSFFERVRAGYLETAQRFPERITIVDAGLAPEQVLDRVLDIIRRRYPNIPGESL